MCGKDFRCEYFHSGKGGACLNFADYVPLPEEAAGHPFGSGWFCKEHCDEARSMLGLNFQDSINKIGTLNNLDESDLPKEYGPVKDPELWVIKLGSTRNKVFSIIRQASKGSPKEAKYLLSKGSFGLLSGWPSEL